MTIARAFLRSVSARGAPHLDSERGAYRPRGAQLGHLTRLARPAAPAATLSSPPDGGAGQIVPRLLVAVASRETTATTRQTRACSTLRSARAAARRSAAARDRMGCRVAHAEAGTSAAGMLSAVASDPERARRDERSKKKNIGKENVPRGTSPTLALRASTTAGSDRTPPSRRRVRSRERRARASPERRFARRSARARRGRRISALALGRHVRVFGGRVVGSGTFGRVATLRAAQADGHARGDQDHEQE